MIRGTFREGATASSASLTSPKHARRDAQQQMMHKGNVRMVHMKSDVSDRVPEGVLRGDRRDPWRAYTSPTRLLRASSGTTPPFGYWEHAQVPSQHGERLQLAAQLDPGQLDAAPFLA